MLEIVVLMMMLLLCLHSSLLCRYYFYSQQAMNVDFDYYWCNHDDEYRAERLEHRAEVFPLIDTLDHNATRMMFVDFYQMTFFVVLFLCNLIRVKKKNHC